MYEGSRSRSARRSSGPSAAPPPGAHDVCHEAGLHRPRLLTRHDDRRLADPWLLFEHRLDFAELDAVAADLDLVIEPAEELDRAVRPPPRLIAGSIAARAGLGGAVGDEPLGGQVGAAEVAARNLHAADHELADAAIRYWLERLVEDVGADPGKGVADRHVGRVDDPRAGRPDRRLGRPIEVP